MARSIPAAGQGYRAVPGWGELPAGWSLQEVVGIAVDRRDAVYVFCRGEHPVLVFDETGRLLRSWGEGRFTRPHGIAIAPDGSVWCTDDDGHRVTRFSPEGDLLQTLGSGEPSDTGIRDRDYRTIARAAGPFNMPTATAFAADGGLYVSDGYGNARVHRFDPEGRLLDSWGEPGAGPGQFHLPHGVATDAAGTLYVADRENSRVQLFTPEGRFLAQWTHVSRPCLALPGPDGSVYVTELGYRAGMYPGNPAPGEDPPGGSVAVLGPRGELLARWGGGADPARPDDFYAPHGIAVDSRGSVYVGEVRPGAPPGFPACPAEAPVLRKFARSGD